MADEEVSDRKDGTERRVYNLPGSLLARLRAYQTNQAISSEVEAVRRLLDYALQMRDTVQNILQALATRFQDEKDLRVLASEILIKHTLVTQVEFEESAVSFKLRNGEAGKISDTGSLHFQESGDGSDYWREYYRVRKTRSVSQVRASAEWKPKGGDLDDEIPF